MTLNTQVTHIVGKLHPKIQNTLWFYLHHKYSEIQEIKKGLHLINLKMKDYTTILFHSFVKIQKLEVNLENSNLFSQSELSKLFSCP